MPTSFKGIAVSLVIAALSVTGAAAQTAGRSGDVAGAADHPDLGRYQGAVITYFRQKSYEEIALPSKALTPEGMKDPASWQTTFSGKLTSIRYEGPEGRSILEVMRNYEAALKKAGLEIKFFCRGKEQCAPRAIPTFWQAGTAGIPGIPSSWDSTIYILAEGKGTGGPVTIALLGVEGSKVNAQKARVAAPFIAATIIDGKAMETDKITVVAADDMAKTIARDGRIAIYGIYFDFDKADIQPASKPQIDELGALLKANPTLDVLVVGHTDGKGGFDYNLQLSQKRAQAVVDALVSGYGIARPRLTPAGAGMVSPVASNRTEDGRAKNRRVEIVELYKGN